MNFRLGMIMGSKIFVDFTKYERKECISRLFKELESIQKKTVSESISKSSTKLVEPDLIKSHHITKSGPQIITWSQQKVEKWLIESEINPGIIKNILPCDGALLNQYYDMQLSCSEFFYNSISFNKQIPFRDVALFGYKLKKLFTDTL